MSESPFDPDAPALRLLPLDARWDAQWDTLAGQNSASGFMQTSAWAAFKRAEGYLTPRYGLFANDALIGGGSLLLYPQMAGAGFIVCPEGPVLDWENIGQARTGLRLLIEQARELSRQYGALGLRIEPHLPPPRPSLLRNWTRAPIDLTPVHTPMLDLTLSDDALRAAMHPKGRYNLGLSTRHGVSVAASTDMADYIPFMRFLPKPPRAMTFLPSHTAFSSIWAQPSFLPTARLCFWRAGSRNPLLPFLSYFLDAAPPISMAAPRPNTAMSCPTMRCTWRLCRKRADAAVVEYDFYGYDPFEQPGHQYAGISRFKRQWGAKRMDSLGAHDLIFYDQLADQLAAALHK